MPSRSTAVIYLSSTGRYDCTTALQLYSCSRILLDEDLVALHTSTYATCGQNYVSRQVSQAAARQTTVIAVCARARHSLGPPASRSSSPVTLSRPASHCAHPASHPARLPPTSQPPAKQASHQAWLEDGQPASALGLLLRSSARSLSSRRSSP